LKRKKSQGINHTDSNTLSENSTNITFDGGNGHCITNIINEAQGINVISNHIKRQSSIYYVMLQVSQLEDENQAPAII